MATFPVSPVDSQNVSNAEKLALERIYSGEVMASFTSACIFDKFVHKKILVHGTSMSFPIMNRGKAEDIKTHKAGEDIEINTVNADERVIAIDDLKYSSGFIDRRQGKIVHFDISTPVTRAMGDTLALHLDQEIGKMFKKAVKTEGIAGQSDGSWIYSADIVDSAKTAKERGEAHIEQIFKMIAMFDENNVPANDRYYVTTPMRWHDISQAPNIRQTNFTSTNGGIDVFNIDVINIGNVKVLKSNNVDLTEDFVGYMFTREAVGLVTLINVITESNYDYKKFGDVLTSRYCFGLGVLNPSCVIGLRSSNTPLS